MNYEKHYRLLVEKAKNRNISGYKEVHHIIPRCMGGSDDKENLVELTAREHFIAHLLLLKIYPKQYGLIKAVACMCIGQEERKTSGNRMYGWLREKFSQEMSTTQSGEKNSQHGTMWVHNTDLKESKKIPKGSQIPDGWSKGRVINFDKKTVKTDFQIKREKDIELYSKYLEIYEKHGFEKFVELTGYSYSKPNLVQRFKKLLPDFKPQNGRKR